MILPVGTLCQHPERGFTLIINHRNGKGFKGTWYVVFWSKSKFNGVHYCNVAHSTSQIATEWKVLSNPKIVT